MKNIKRNLRLGVTVAVLAVCIIAGIVNAAPADSLIFQAMGDELSRSMSDLVMENLERPYFISYTMDDFQNLGVVGVLGNLTRSNLDRGRYLTVDLRVGTASLDNSNFVAGFFDNQQNSFPISFENDYDAIRNSVYLATDRLYKAALKNLSRKKAYLQTRIMTDRPDDFIAQSANVYMGNLEPFNLEKAPFEDLAKAASGIFKEYPEIISSSVRISAAVNDQYLVTSARTRTLRGNRLYTINLTMAGKNSDGEDIEDGDQLVLDQTNLVPAKAALTSWARENAQRMTTMLKARKIDEYTGPVILDGQAAGEFFRQLLAKNISDSPSPLFERDEVAEQSPGPELANKLKRRVLPEFIDIIDDPTLTTFDGADLIGHYDVDDAGNKAQRIQLVDDGKLLTLPIGQAPTKKIKEGNGHARGAVGRDISGRTSNMLVESSDAVPYAKLKTAMLEMCRDMGLEYGLVVRELADPSSPRQRMSFSFGGGGNRSALTAPVEAYLVYLDGHEEPVIGLEFSNVTVRLLRDILETGDQTYCHNYMIGNDNELPASIVAPSLLVEEMELKKSEAKVNKPLVVSSPLSKR